MTTTKSVKYILTISTLFSISLLIFQPYQQGPTHQRENFQSSSSTLKALWAVEYFTATFLTTFETTATGKAWSQLSESLPGGAQVKHVSSFMTKFCWDACGGSITRFCQHRSSFEWPSLFYKPNREGWTSKARDPLPEEHTGLEIASFQCILAAQPEANTCF